MPSYTNVRIPGPRLPVPDVILPVLDEVEAIPSVLAGLPAGFTPVVVDNGSVDGSGELAADLGARVVREPARGFGAACHAGLIAATDDVVCFMDCDGSFDGRDLRQVAEPVERGVADLVLGARRAEPSAWPVHARLANRWLTRSIRRRTGLRLHDLGPMRAARRLALLELGLRDRGSGWPLEMVLAAGAAGWTVDEVDVAYRARTGKSKVTGTVRGTARAVYDMTRVLRWA
jgi:glycosyltransferase involved in cell wall biosynthesis